MKRCKYLIEIPNEDSTGWSVIAKTDTEDNAALIASGMAERVEAGTARYSTGGPGSLQFYRKEKELA